MLHRPTTCQIQMMDCEAERAALMQEVFIYDSHLEAEVDDLRQEAAVAHEEALAAQAEAIRLQAELDELRYEAAERDAMQEEMIAGLQAELEYTQEEHMGTVVAEAELEAQQEEITRLNAALFFGEEELRDTQRAWRAQADCQSIIAEQMVALKNEFDGAIQALDTTKPRGIYADPIDAEYQEYQA